MIGEGRPAPSSAVLGALNEAVELLTERWIERVAVELFLKLEAGAICMKCARTSLLTTALAAGLGPVTVARILRDVDAMWVERALATIAPDLDPVADAS